MDKWHTFYSPSNVLDTNMIELEVFKYESQGLLSDRFKTAITQGETLHEWAPIVKLLSAPLTITKSQHLALNPLNY